MACHVLGAVRMKKPFLVLFGIVLTTLSFPSEAAPFAIATREIVLNGYNLFANSFDSSDPLQSTDGHYDPLKGGGDLAVVASETGIRNSINVGTVEIWGTLETGLPFFLETSAQSSIGSIAWHQSNQTGIEPGYHTTNGVPVFPDAVEPLPGLVPTSGTYNGVNYDYLLSDGVYTLPSLTMSGGQAMLVIGNSQLDVKGNASLSGQSHIRILPSASLRMYVAGTGNLRGNGIINEGVAGNFIYFGIRESPTLHLRVATRFSGTIYAPYAVCTITSGGNSAAEIEGYVAARSVELGSDVNFHVDVDFQ
jgi:hypothetical protein